MKGTVGQQIFLNTGALGQSAESRGPKKQVMITLQEMAVFNS